MSTVRTPFTLCCVLDAHPRFYVEIVLWVLCAKRYLPQNKYRLVVYLHGNIPRDLVRWIELSGVETRATETVVEGSPHCNKIAPFFDDHESEAVIVCDTDLFFVGDPSEHLGSRHIRAAPNNHGVPPAKILKAVLAASGLGHPYRPGMALLDGGAGRETHINNISAGIVVSPTESAHTLAATWKKWADWTVAHRELLEQYGVHVDQVGFMLAMEELREDVEFLPPQVNTILHMLSETDNARAFHLSTGHVPEFPERFNANATLRTAGLPEGMVAAIERLNSQIRIASRAMSILPATQDHLDLFMNPYWRRETGIVTVPASEPCADDPRAALRTSRLLLRQWREDDVENFAALSADPLVMRHLPRIASRADSDQAAAVMREHWERYGFGNWIVELPGQRAMIGIVGLTRVQFDAFADEIAVGWRFFPAYWGRGYALEAVQAAIADGFERLRFEEVVAFTTPLNHRSERLMQRLGMVRDANGNFDHPAYPEGDPARENVVYRLSKSRMRSTAGYPSKETPIEPLGENTVPRGPMHRPKIVVGSGWWSEPSAGRWLIGDQATKTPAFFELWLHLVRRYIDPAEIVVLDNNAPLKPAAAAREGIKWLELDRNYGSPNDIRVGAIATKYCGYTRSLMMGAMFALCSDADIYCYVEQDCVVRGHSLIAEALAGREPTILVGGPTENGRGLDGTGAAPMHQNSLVLVGQSSLERFLAGITAGSETDGELSPEIKLVRDCAPVDILEIPYGRSRPIDFERPCYYAEHLTGDELRHFLAVEGLSAEQFGLSICEPARN